MRFLLGFNSSLYSAGILLGGIQLSSKKLDFLMRCIWQYISLAFNVITLMKVLIFFLQFQLFSDVTYPSASIFSCMENHKFVPVLRWKNTHQYGV